MGLFSLGDIVGNVLGGIIGKGVSSAMDLKSSKELIKAQLDAQKELFEFENTNKHQFEIGDLKAAGLNPILSAMNPSAIGVGGVSAPNWSSDDDVFGPASARAMQQKQISVQEEATKIAGVQAEAALLKARSEGFLNITRALNEKEMQEYQIRNIVSQTVKNTTEGKQNLANVERIFSEIPVNKEKAKNVAEDTTHKRLTNEQILEMNTILKDPKYDKEEFKYALAYALTTGKNWTDALAFAISKSAVDEVMRAKKNVLNGASSSAKGLDDVDNAFNRFDIID